MDHREELFDFAEEYCKSYEWNYDADRERHIIALSIGLRCQLKSVRMIFDVKDNGIIIYVIAKLNASPEDYADFAEFITRANYGIAVGNFEFDYRDGEIRYKSNLISHQGLPSIEDMELAVDSALFAFDHYGNGISKLLLGFGEAEYLIQEIEKEDQN